MAKEQGVKPIAQNKKARHDYAIEDKYEAGLVLTGTEVKSLREGRASLAESFITIDRRGEMWLEEPTFLNISMVRGTIMPLSASVSCYFMRRRSTSWHVKAKLKVSPSFR